MRTSIVTDPFEFHHMIDAEKAVVAVNPPISEQAAEEVWSDWSYAPWLKVGRLPKNAWRAVKRDRALQRRKRWMARNPGK